MTETKMEATGTVAGGEVVPRESYQVVPTGAASRKYFEDKYGTAEPTWVAEAPDRVVWPNGGWGMQDGNPACLLFGMRTGFDGGSWGEVWYGHIGAMGELVQVDELRVLDTSTTDDCEAVVPEVQA